MTQRRLAALSSLLAVLLGVCALNASTASARVERDGTHLIAYVEPGSTVALRTSPSGRVVGRVGSMTPFGSDRALGVITSRGSRWLGVTEARFGHNRLLWVDALDGGLQFARTDVALYADLSSRTLVVRRNGVALRRFRVGVGRPGSPTPTGSFAITDKLDGRDTARSTAAASSCSRLCSRIYHPAGGAATALRSTERSPRATSAVPSRSDVCTRATRLCAT